MKIVQINTFHNKATGGIMMNIHNLLNQAGYDSYVVWGRGREPKNDHEILMNSSFDVKLHGIYTRLTDKTGFGSSAPTKRLIKQLDTIKPDIIHLHNIHGYYINIELLFNYIRMNNIRLVWTLHDCWPITGHCAYFDMCGCNKWKNGCFDCEQKATYPSSLLIDNSKWNWNKKKDLFSDLNLTIVTPSKWLKDLVQESYLGQYPTHIIHNGIDLNVYKPTINKDILTKFNLDNRPIILGVASEWTERKGLKDFYYLSELMPDYQFVVVGLTDKQKASLPGTIHGFTRTENVQELVSLYSSASVFFNPTYEDNFPTTNLEALACGTPILTYNTGGSPEAVTSDDVGTVVQKNTPQEADLTLVKDELEKLSSRADSIRSNCRDASQHFNKDLLFRKYIDLYETLYTDDQA